MDQNDARMLQFLTNNLPIPQVDNSRETPQIHFEGASHDQAVVWMAMPQIIDWIWYGKLNGSERGEVGSQGPAGTPRQLEVQGMAGP